MQVYFPASLTETTKIPALTPMNLASLAAKHLTQLLVGPPPLLFVDCGGLLIPHPLGGCRFVAQLPQLRLRGARMTVQRASRAASLLVPVIPGCCTPPKQIRWQQKPSLVVDLARAPLT